MAQNRPNKPNVTLPDSFGGVKNEFSSTRISNGYESSTPEIVEGGNLNYMLDGLFRNTKYMRTVLDYVRDTPVGKMFWVNSNGQMDYIEPAIIATDTEFNTGTATDKTPNVKQVVDNLEIKANNNAVVHLTGNETISGEKTFSSSPLVPTAASGDNSTKAASTAFVTSADNNLQTQINAKANNNAVVHLTGDETITGFKTFKNDIFLGGVAGSGQEGGQINFNAGESETNQNVFNFDRNGGEFRFFGVGLDGNVHVPLRININNNLVYANPSDVSNTIVTTTGISKSGNGFVKLGNGIIIQWGRSNTVSGSPERTVTFPTAFSSATSYTIAKNYQSSAGTDAQDREVSFYNMTSTGATTYSPSGDTSQFSWFAIGY